MVYITLPRCLGDGHSSLLKSVGAKMRIKVGQDVTRARQHPGLRLPRPTDAARGPTLQRPLHLKRSPGGGRQDLLHSPSREATAGQVTHGPGARDMRSGLAGRSIEWPMASRPGPCLQTWSGGAADARFGEPGLRQGCLCRAARRVSRG